MPVQSSLLELQLAWRGFMQALKEAVATGPLFSSRPPWEHGIQLRLTGSHSYLLRLHMPS